MALATGAGAIFLLIGRILFGGVLAYIGLSNFTDSSEMAEYAQSKGVPAASFGVIVSNVLLVLGGVGILLGVYPMIAAGMVAVFFLLVTPMMHDFWAVPAEQRENEMAHFQCSSCSAASRGHTRSISGCEYVNRTHFGIPSDRGGQPHHGLLRVVRTPEHSLNCTVSERLLAMTLDAHPGILDIQQKRQLKQCSHGGRTDGSI